MTSLEDLNINGSHENALLLAIINVIKPIYREFVSPEVLSKYRHWKVQDSNEPLNALIKNQWLKRKSAGEKD
jgi:hypothetical protein